MPQTSPLLFTKSPRDRVLVAISWDVRAKKTTVVDVVRGTNQQHDLDLSCFVYDEHGEYIDFVGSMAQDSMDQSGAIYHSGDDATGEGDGDDESISCELAGLDHVHSLVFVTEIRSNHTFAEIDDPYVRIADGMTNQNLFELHMAKKGGMDKSACVMAKIFRDPDSSTGWSLQIIEFYPSIEDVSDWGSYLVRYLG